MQYRSNRSRRHNLWLQWVHGLRTVVMSVVTAPGIVGLPMLQWVHGLRTVVMGKAKAKVMGLTSRASMGPRSENRGYAFPSPWLTTPFVRASMGPRSENRGYVDPDNPPYDRGVRLQWVHGLRTVVMQSNGHFPMPPWTLQWVHGLRTVVMRSATAPSWRPGSRFNGSTV